MPQIHLRQEFRDWLPIIAVPALGEVVGFAIRETGVIENKLGGGALVGELEFRDGEDAGIPAAGAPGLDDAFAGDEFDLAADDVAAENGKSAAGFATNLGGRGRLNHSRLHGGAELDHFVELLRVGEGVVDALARGFEDDFLVDGFASMGNFVGRCRRDI